MKIQKVIIFLVVFLLPLLFVENISKADEVDKGNYIKIKLQVDSGSDKIYNTYSANGTDGPFDVTGTSYLGNECALLLSEKNLAWDDLYIVWVENEVIIGRGSSLSNDIGSDYDRCCHGIDSAVPNISCLTDAGEARCKWNGPTDGDVREAFELNYGILENQCPSDAVCQFAPLVGAARSYGEFSDMLCETEWRMCLGPNDTCHPYNGRDYACNDSSGDWQWENCTAAGKTCVSGACVAASGLTLTISADPTAIGTTSTSAIDFLVEDTYGNPVSGVTITITAVTEAAGTVMVGASCVTNLSGICPGGLIYGSGLSVGLKTITAEADDGINPVVSSTVDVIVGDVNFECDVTGTKWFDPISFNIGLCADLDGDSCGSGKEYENCGPCHESNCPDGTFSSCFIKYQVCGCDCATTAGPACTTIWGSWSACAGAPGTQTRSNTGTCVVSDQSRFCCDDDSNCVIPSPFCNVPAGPAGQCVECIDNDDCAGTNVCDNYFCIPCIADGEIPPSDNEDLCCLGLGYWDADGDGTDECTSACDPSAWFFCNPLRGSVGTVVEAGEQILGYILGLIGSIALLFIIIAGMMYMTSAGNEEKISSSKRILNGAAIGLAIALLAYGLLHVIMTVLGM